MVFGPSRIQRDRFLEVFDRRLRVAAGRRPRGCVQIDAAKQPMGAAMYGLWIGCDRGLRRFDHVTDEAEAFEVHRLRPRPHAQRVVEVRFGPLAVFDGERAKLHAARGHRRQAFFRRGHRLVVDGPGHAPQRFAIFGIAGDDLLGSAAGAIDVGSGWAHRHRSVGDLEELAAVVR